jgi:hypothetical protein
MILHGHVNWKSRIGNRELEIANWKSRKHLNVLLTQSIPGHISADSFLILGSTLSRNP